MMDAKLRLDIYRKMILSRRLEERIAELIKSGQAGGFMHPGVGQEALQVAAIATLRPDDYMLYAHRGVAYWIARGVDERPVHADRIRNTFPADIFTFEAAREALQPIIEKVWRTCEGAEIRGRTVTLKVKYADFQQITRSRTGQALFSTRAEIEQLSYALLEPLFPVTKGIRLLGMTLSSLGEQQLESEPQLSLSFKAD